MRAVALLCAACGLLGCMRLVGAVDDGPRDDGPRSDGPAHDGPRSDGPAHDGPGRDAATAELTLTRPDAPRDVRFVSEGVQPGDLNPTPPPGSVRFATGRGSLGLDRAVAVAVDSVGNIYVLGTFSGQLAFGSDMLVSKGTQNLFLAALDATGTRRWALRLGSQGFDEAGGIALDEPRGQLVVTGTAGGTFAFDGSGNPVNSLGQTDVVLAAYALSDGALRWARVLGGPGTDAGHSVAVDPQGNVYVTGRFSATANFGKGALLSRGALDIFVASTSSLGATRWAAGYGGAADDVGYGIAANAGRVLVTGGHAGGTLGGSGASFGAGGLDIFVASYRTSDGAHQWDRSWGTPGVDTGRSVLIVGDVVYAAGSVSGPLDFGGGTLAAAGDRDAFVLALEAPSGVHQWSRRYGSAQTDDAYGLAHTGAAVVVVGEFWQTLSDSSGAAGWSLQSAGGSDVFALSLAPSNGNKEWAVRVGGTGSDEGRAIAMGQQGLVVVGAYTNTVTVAGTALVSAGSSDMLLFGLTP